MGAVTDPIGKFTNPRYYTSGCKDDSDGNDQKAKNWWDKYDILPDWRKGKMPEGITEALVKSMGVEEVRKMLARSEAFGLTGSLIGLRIGYHILHLDPDKNMGNRRVLQQAEAEENGAKKKVKISQK